MTRITCEECGKRYLYEEDDFCPRCGAYNQPRKSSGAVLRVDGVSESNHEGSFTHREIHREKRQRRILQLDRPETPVRQKTIAQPLAGAGPQRKKENTTIGAVVIAVVWVIIILQFLVLSLYG